MDSELWTKAESIFHQASELPPDGRDAFVREACAGDRALEREVRSLLSWRRDTRSIESG